MNLNDVRSLFPHLATGQTYFNHAAIGPWCTPALERINEYASQRSGIRVENYPFFLKWNASAKEKLGKLLNASPDRIAWVDNVSNGLNIPAQGIEWKAGDRIILNNIEFPSNIYPFLNLKKLGVDIDFVEASSGKVDVDDIAKLITPKTKLISISLVQFLSGYRADISAIGDLCRSRGIIFCVDAIQAAGVVEIDVVKSNVDFLAGGTQKWLMSSQGLSYIYLTEEFQSRIDQKSVGWTSVENAWDLLDYDITLKKTADRFQNGTVNALGVAIFDAVLDVFLNYGMENAEKNILENSSYLIYSLSELGLKPVLKNAGREHIAGIISFTHEKAKEINSEFEKKNIFVAERMSHIRISPHFYNTKDEIDLVIDELKKMKI